MSYYETRYVAWSRDAKLALLSRGGEAVREIIAKEHNVPVQDVRVGVNPNDETVYAAVTKLAKDWQPRSALEAATRDVWQ